jgi:hypothetical protein
VKGCNLTIRRSFATGPQPDVVALSYSNVGNRGSTGSNINLYGSRVHVYSASTNIRCDLFISNAYDSTFSYYNLGQGLFIYLQNGGSLVDCIFDRTNIEFLDDYSAFSGCKSYLGQFALVFYSGFDSSNRRNIVRNFSPIGATTNYYLDARNALTFINSPDVSLPKGNIDDLDQWALRLKHLRRLSIYTSSLIQTVL